MPRKRSNAAALFDMLQAAQTVRAYVAGKSRDDYEFQGLLRHAVERNLEIIGEAARRLDSAFVEQHPEIPWRAITATRHILAHEYDEIDNDIVWRIVTDHVPALISLITPLVPTTGSSLFPPPSPNSATS